MAVSAANTIENPTSYAIAKMVTEVKIVLTFQESVHQPPVKMKVFVSITREKSSANVKWDLVVNSAK